MHPFKHNFPSHSAPPATLCLLSCGFLPRDFLPTCAMHNVQAARSGNGKPENNFLVSPACSQMTLDILDWASLTDVSCVIESQLNMHCNNGKNLRQVYALLLARGKVSLNVFSSLSPRPLSFYGLPGNSSGGGGRNQEQIVFLL